MIWSYNMEQHLRKHHAGDEIPIDLENEYRVTPEELENLKILKKTASSSGSGSKNSKRKAASESNSSSHHLSTTSEASGSRKRSKT